MGDAIAVPVDLVRIAAACLRATTSRQALHAGQRLTELLREHENPDLFSEPAEPVRDVVEHHLPEMHSPTGRKMRAKVWPTTGTYRMEMLRMVAACGEYGLSDYDLEDRMHRSHQSVSATRNGLVADGWLEAATHTNGTARVRGNRFGNDAQVWVPTAAALRRLASA